MPTSRVQQGSRGQAKATMERVDSLLNELDQLKQSAIRKGVKTEEKLEIRGDLGVLIRRAITGALFDLQCMCEVIDIALTTPVTKDASVWFQPIHHKLCVALYHERRRLKEIIDDGNTNQGNHLS